MKYKLSILNTMTENQMPNIKSIDDLSTNLHTQKILRTVQLEAKMKILKVKKINLEFLKKKYYQSIFFFPLSQTHNKLSLEKYMIVKKCFVTDRTFLINYTDVKKHDVG